MSAHTHTQTHTHTLQNSHTSWQNSLKCSAEIPEVKSPISTVPSLSLADCLTCLYFLDNFIVVLYSFVIFLLTTASLLGKAVNRVALLSSHAPSHFPVGFCLLSLSCHFHSSGEAVLHGSSFYVHFWSILPPPLLLNKGVYCSLCVHVCVCPDFVQMTSP